MLDLTESLVDEVVEVVEDVAKTASDPSLANLVGNIESAMSLISAIFDTHPSIKDAVKELLNQ